MGNNNSNSNYGNLYVRTDKPYYFSGEQVTGTIYCNITQNGYYGNMLYLKVKGFEKCNWEENRQVQERNSDGSMRSVTVTDQYHGKSMFYSHKIILYTFNGQYLQPGQFAFPFTFTLFGHLPGSFQERGHQYSASIIYKVKGEIESFSKDNKKIKHTQELIVREPLKQQLASIQGEMTVQAKTWCCISQGTSKIKCVFDKNAYLPGDQAILRIDVDNSECDLNVKEIRGVLNRTLTLRSTCGRSKTFNNEMVREQTLGILARTTAINEQGKNMQIQLINRNGDANNQVIKPSTNGQVVRCEYQLSSTAILQGCTCCSSDPSVVVPVNIVSPVPIIYNQVPQVQNWNPQTFEPVLVSFTQNDMYQQNNQGQQNPYIQNMNQNMIM